MRDRFSRLIERIPVEPSVLLILAIAAGLVLALGKIVEDVVEHESGAFDHAILKALRTPGNLSQPIGPAWLEEVVKNITALGSPTVLALVTVFSLAYLLVARRYRLTLVTACAIVGGAIVEKALKMAFHRARPEIVPHLVMVDSMSFPSGHAMLSTITYLTLGALLARAQRTRRLRVFVFSAGVVMALLIGASRVYLGVHYPTDVLAGWCFGSLWVCLFWLVARRHTRSGPAAAQGQDER